MEGSTMKKIILLSALAFAMLGCNKHATTPEEVAALTTASIPLRSEVSEVSEVSEDVSFETGSFAREVVYACEKGGTFIARYDVRQQPTLETNAFLFKHYISTDGGPDELVDQQKSEDADITGNIFTVTIELPIRVNDKEAELNHTFSLTYIKDTETTKELGKFSFLQKPASDCIGLVEPEEEPKESEKVVLPCACKVSDDNKTCVPKDSSVTPCECAEFKVSDDNKSCVAVQTPCETPCEAAQK